MYKPLIKTNNYTKIENPTFLKSISDLDKVSFKVTKLILKHIKPIKISEIYSPYFSDFIFTYRNGLFSLPKYQVYINNNLKPNIILLKEKGAKKIEDQQFNYKLASNIVKYILKLKCKKIIIYGTFIPKKIDNNKIHIAGTSKKIILNTSKKIYCDVLSKKKINGLAGLILGIAKSYKIEGLCILKPLIEDVPIEISSLNLFNSILKIL